MGTGGIPRLVPYPAFNAAAAFSSLILSASSYPPLFLSRFPATKPPNSSANSSVRLAFSSSLLRSISAIPSNRLFPSVVVDLPLTSRRTVESPR